MNMDESYSDMLANAIKYGISNKRTILIWGIISLVAYILFFIGYALVLIFTRSQWAWAVFVLAFIPMLAIGVLSMGYMCRCLRELLNGNNMAPGLSRPVEMAVDSIKILIIYLEAIIGIIIVFIPMFLVLYLDRGGNSTALVILCLLYPIELILTIVIVSLNMIQWAVLADTGSLARGLNPITPIHLVLADLKNSVMVAVLAFILYIAYTIITVVCVMLVCTLLLLPFIMIPFYCAGMYLLARFYQRATGKYTRSPMPTA